jgi:transposase
MTQYKRIAIDTSKSVFTVHGIDAQDRPVLRTNLRRGQLLPFFRKLAVTEVAIESCGGSHHWARELTALGHSPRLVPPQYVAARTIATTPRRFARPPGVPACISCRRSLARNKPRVWF